MKRSPPPILIGREVRHTASTGSTNDSLKELARLGAPEGLVLSTDEQTTGRGRRGRTWIAPPGSSLLLSVLLRPTWLPAPDAFYLTMMAAVACVEAIEPTTGAAITLKWPNDLEADGRKLGGILVETEIASGEIAWAVIGIGINLNWDPATIPELAGSATSLAALLGRPVDRQELFAAVLHALDEQYRRLQAGARETIHSTWRSRLSTVGRVVRVERSGEIFEGLAEGVAQDGALVVRDRAGIRHEVTSGEVTVRALPEDGPP